MLDPERRRSLATETLLAYSTHRCVLGDIRRISMLVQRNPPAHSVLLSKSERRNFDNFATFLFAWSTVPEDGVGVKVLDLIVFYRVIDLNSSLKLFGDPLNTVVKQFFDSFKKEALENEKKIIEINLSSDY